MNILSTNKGTRSSPKSPALSFSACSACSALIVVIAVAHVLAQEPRATQTVTPANYVGTWVGVQRWAADVTSPGPAEEQEVTLTIEEFNGKLVGTMAPFFG